MEHYLTRKARPNWLLGLMEPLLFVALGFWCAVGVDVTVERFSRSLAPQEVFACLVVVGVPLAVWCWLLRRWMLRRSALKAARVLAQQHQTVVTWAHLEDAGLRNAQRLLGKLWEKDYLHNITCGEPGVMLAMPEGTVSPAPNGGKCAMCGAPLERRTFGDWACRHCGTVAGR